MKSIASRVTNLEQHIGRVRHVRTNAGADADFARLMADEAGREAVIEFSNYMRANHPNARANMEALAADKHATRLYKAILAEVERTGTGRWMTWRTADASLP
jgi:hypothetical protein